ncbi:hypothetical protein EC973_007627 [Apophysomyces ossiformis]|uniref:Uncharacterized protein n=1 Tax=Apophysomyces ossiformis TaxID=679940 RepID=A0A8H7BJF3_9FUNG|nr:hypothetical protein EC973_007627 [Apophysomyces ossiformis]
MPHLAASEVIGLLKEVLKIIEERADDWANVIPEALVLKNQCSVIETILPRIDTALGEESLQYRCMATIKTTLESAKAEIEEFIRRDTKERHLWGKVLWNSKRVFLATDYRQSFKNKAETLTETIQKIAMYMNLGDTFRKFTVDQVKDHMSPASYEFWTKHIGNHVSHSNAWAIFIQQYQGMHGPLSDDAIESIRRVACVSGTDLTIYGFIRVTKQYGFPVDVCKLPPLPVSNAVMSEEARMQLAKMVMSLMAEYSSKVVHRSIIRINLWYEHTKKDDPHAMQRRADEWAEYIVQARKTANKKPIHKEAENVEYARRTISMFYQRYMVMWRIGKVSRQMLSDVDFPGRSRMRDFIRCISPLDYANFRIVLGQDPSEWDERKPQVYSFLEELCHFYTYGGC